MIYSRWFLDKEKNLGIVVEKARLFFSIVRGIMFA